MKFKKPPPPEPEEEKERDVPVVLNIELSCCYCHSTLAQDDVVYCGKCLAPHHLDCFQEHTRCSAPGCDGEKVVRPEAAGRAGRKGRGAQAAAAIGATLAALLVLALLLVTSSPPTVDPPLVQPPTVPGTQAPAWEGLPALQTARSMAEEKSYTKAVSFYRQALRDGVPDRARVHSECSQVLGLAGQFDEAVKEASAALALEPESFNYTQLRGNARHEAGDFRGALADHKRTLQINESSTGHYLCATACKKLGDLNRSLEHFSRAIELNPNYVLALAGRGGVNLQLGNFEQAIVDCQRAIDLDSTYRLAWLRMGLSQEALGQTAEAVRSFDRAVELDPTWHLPYRYRARVQASNGNREAALVDARRAVQFKPNDRGSQKILAQIEGSTPSGD